VKFLKSGRNRLNPKRLADAMAGLPVLGCRHSSRLCSLRPCSLWPHLDYLEFKEIERICKIVQQGDRANATDRFRLEIVALPKKPRDFKLCHVRSRLCQNWRYLNLAIASCIEERIGPREMPYKIISEFSIHLAKPRDALESLRVEQEAL
jgi:hypothetical protein